MNQRQYSFLDHAINQIDRGIAALLINSPYASRPNPADSIPEATLNDTKRKHSASLMRVNHSGEICAQALYYGQLLTARSIHTQHLLQQSAIEETDHLAWTQQRLIELNSRTSYLNPYWYSSSLILGMLAGLAGDPWSLGFVEETERQVAKHLDKHLHQLAPEDFKSRAIIQQMHQDEENHGKTAQLAGAKPLPALIKCLMTLQAKVMTTLAYWV